MTVRVSRKRSRGRCGECAGCQQPNCGTCADDMKCFGGPGTKKKACRNRKCTGLSAAHATAATHRQNVATTISKLSSLAHGSGENVLQSTRIIVFTQVRVAFSKPVHAARARVGPPGPNHGAETAKPSSHHVHVTMM